MKQVRSRRHLVKMFNKILTYSFYLLFALTPLLWAPWNFELFEYNKMMFVYALTIIITTSWVIQMVQTKKLLLKTTPLDIPLMIFLLANILSTVFSIDKNTSLWGYYSRSNGGLLSLISYLLLYYALVSNFEKEQVLKFLKWAVYGGVVVALYAIPEHFGVSPSCLFLTGQANASCWVQDVQARVFATLGQPNWLGAYLAMLIFPALYFLLTSTKKLPLILNTFYLILLYLAFTFTYSRGATLGLIAGTLVFLTLFLWQTISNLRPHPKVLDSEGRASNARTRRGAKLKLIGSILVIFIGVNLLFGSALTDFKLLSKFAPPSRPSLATISKPSGTQLENGGTESGKIRLIVWRGALDIFKHYPVFGSGVETFAYSYYNFRPVEHNLVSEWDFLYNKAHNEFLNYLATTGLLGFLSYMSVILAFVVWSIKYLVSSIKGKDRNTYYLILIPCLLAAYISYLIQNIFGFSVVIIALFFYLFPAIAFVLTDTIKPFNFPPIIRNTYPLIQIIYRRPFYSKLATWIVAIIGGLIFLTLFRYYIADTNFSTGSKVSDTNPGKAYNKLIAALSLNKREPYYHSELAYAAAGASVALQDINATQSALLKEEAVEETELTLLNSPKNVSYFRSAVRTYYMLSTADKSFTQKTLDTLDQAMTLAPTDAKLPYNKAMILGQMGKNTEAIKALEQAIILKPNYKEAYYSLGLFYAQEKHVDKAIEAMSGILKFIPGDPDALSKIKEWENKQ